MVEDEAAGFVWDALCELEDVVAVGVEVDGAGGPVEAVFVVAEAGVEGDGTGLPDIAFGDVGRGVDNQEEGGFGGVGVEFREELDVDFGGVVAVLGVAYQHVSCSFAGFLEFAERVVEGRLTKKKAPHVPCSTVYFMPTRKLPYSMSRRAESISAPPT